MRFDRFDDGLERNRTAVLGLFRVVVGMLFACHGAATLFGVLGGPHGAGPAPGEWPGWWAAGIQLCGGAAVLLGLVTRPAAVICSGSMAYAYFTAHQAHALFPIENGGEAAAMFCWTFLLIAAYGPGRWALEGNGRWKRSRHLRPGMEPADDPGVEHGAGKAVSSG